MFNPINAIFSLISIPEPARTLEDTWQYPPVSGYEDDTPETEPLPVKWQPVRNIVSGECGIVRSVWLNQWSNQYVVNVRVQGRMASWNVAETGRV